jgi:hypothetical protein
LIRRGDLHGLADILPAREIPGIGKSLALHGLHRLDTADVHAFEK